MNSSKFTMKSLQKTVGFLTTVIFAIFISVNIYLISRTTLSMRRADSMGKSTISSGAITTPSVTQDFQRIGNGSVKTYAYSAYFQRKGVTGLEGESVIVIAGLLANSPSDVYCQIYNENLEMKTNVKGVLKALDADNKHWQLPYVPYYIICSCSDINTTESIPSFVSLVESEEVEEKRTNLLKITFNDQQKYTFSVCMQPFYNYEQPFRLVEWMEYHILMGVEKFTFYNTSLGPKTSCLLKSYGDIVEMLPFSSPYEFQKEIQVGGQLLSNHECVQRHRGVSKYVIIVDRDEMIMPTTPSNGNNFKEMMDLINEHLIGQNHSISGIAAYTFLNKFFITDWDIDENSTSSFQVLGMPNSEKILKNLQMSTRVIRETSYETWRTKYILVPDLVVAMHTHYVNEAVGNAESVTVPDDMAYMHHYRNCQHSTGFDLNCDEKDKVLDTSAQRFAEQVALKISERIFSIAKNCNIEIEEKN